MSLLTRLDNLRWEMRFGISTRSVVEIDKPDACHYASVDYTIIHSVLARLALKPTDVFIDIGCGKGRVLCCAAAHVVSLVVGIEYSADMVAAARANAVRMRGRRSPISVHHGPAEAFDYAGATALFMFNPFGAATLGTVLPRIEADVPSGLRLAFVNPSADQDAVFAARGWSTASRFRKGEHDAVILHSPVARARSV